MAKRIEVGIDVLIRGLRYQHLEWSDKAPGFVIKPVAMQLRILRDSRIEEGLSVFSSSANLNELLSDKTLGFKALATIEKKVITGFGYRIRPKWRNPNAAEVLGLPLPDHDESRPVAETLVKSLIIVRAPSAAILARLKADWEYHHC